MHQGRSGAAALGKVHAECIAQQVSAFRSLFQFIAHQAGVHAGGGQRLVDVADAVAEVVPVHFLSDSAQFRKFLAGRAGLGGKLVGSLSVIRAKLHDLLGPFQRRGRQGGDGRGRGGQTCLHGAAGHAGHAVHGVGQSRVALLRFIGGVGLFFHRVCQLVCIERQRGG